MPHRINSPVNAYFEAEHDLGSIHLFADLKDVECRAIALQGYFNGRVTAWLRLVMAAAGFLALTSMLALQLTGLTVISVCLAWLWRGERLAPAIPNPK